MMLNKHLQRSLVIGNDPATGCEQKRKRNVYDNQLSVDNNQKNIESVLIKLTLIEWRTHKR